MTADLEGLAKAYRRAQKTADDRRDALHLGILESVEAGVRQVEIVRITGYTRERIRQLVDAARRAQQTPEDDAE